MSARRIAGPGQAARAGDELELELDRDELARVAEFVRRGQSAQAAVDAVIAAHQAARQCPTKPHECWHPDCSYPDCTYERDAGATSNPSQGGTRPADSGKLER